jgi:transcriptional regulator
VSGEAGATVRERLREALLEGPASARDLSRALHVSEAEVHDHLPHVERSLRPRGERLVTCPSQCLACGFEFARRERFTRPGRCPRCHSRRLSLPRFRIERRGGAAGTPR